MPLLYWTAASLGAAIALAPDRPDLVIDFPIVRALPDRALALDETWSKGAIHEVMITLESLPRRSAARRTKAREHFDRAVDLQHGDSAGSVRRAGHGRLGRRPGSSGVREADEPGARDRSRTRCPSTRLVDLITQRRARALLDHADACSRSDRQGGSPEDVTPSRQVLVTAAAAALLTAAGRGAGAGADQARHVRADQHDVAQRRSRKWATVRRTTSRPRQDRRLRRRHAGPEKTVISADAGRAAAGRRC